MMKMHTLYSKLLFVGAGLLFAFNISAQDTLNQLDGDYFRNGYWLLNMDNTPSKSKNGTFYSEGIYEHGYKTGIWQTFINGKLRSQEMYENTRIEKYIKYDENGNLIEMGILDVDGFLIEGNRAKYDDNHYQKSRMTLGRKGKIMNGEYYDAFYECWFTFKDSLGKYYTSPSKDCDTVKLKKEKPPKTCDPENLPIEKKKEIIQVKTVSGNDCEIFKRLERESVYLDKKIANGYSILCDNKGLVLEVQYFEKSKFIRNVNMLEVDSVLNSQVKTSWRNLNDDDPSYPKNPSQMAPKNIVEDGYFKDGLFNGKKYIYDKNGLIEKIEEWKLGKYVGDGQID